MNTQKRLKIAIQKSGRLNQGSMEYLFGLGLKFAPNGHSLIQSCINEALDILFLRDDDIPQFVSRGVADIGIVGQNVLFETRAETRVVKRLDFARCKLMIAVPKNSGIKTIQDLKGERIATTYPYLLSRFLAEKNIDASIIPIAGSAEIAPEMNLADAVCDIVQTGKTLAAHNLISLITILESQAVLIAHHPGKVAQNNEKLIKLLTL
jgi:ATP phosphoribosyltransferase